MNGTRILAIKDVGTSDQDKLAYVNCTVHDGSTYAIAFAHDLSNSVCNAFLAATAHLQHKRALRGLPTEHFTVDINDAYPTLETKPVPAVVFDLSTKSGAKLSFRLNRELAHAFAQKLSNLLKTQTQ